jgi:hypothetical protein
MGAWSLILEVKPPVRGADHVPPSRAEVKERVQLYLYFPSGPSWPVLEWTSLFFPSPFRVAPKYLNCSTLAKYFFYPSLCCDFVLHADFETLPFTQFSQNLLLDQPPLTIRVSGFLYNMYATTQYINIININQVFPSGEVQVYLWMLQWGEHCTLNN